MTPTEKKNNKMKFNLRLCKYCYHEQCIVVSFRKLSCLNHENQQLENILWLTKISYIRFSDSREKIINNYITSPITTATNNFQSFCQSEVAMHWSTIRIDQCSFLYTALEVAMPLLTWFLLALPQNANLHKAIALTRQTPVNSLSSNRTALLGSNGPLGLVSAPNFVFKFLDTKLLEL